MVICVLCCSLLASLVDANLESPTQDIFRVQKLAGKARTRFFQKTSYEVRTIPHPSSLLVRLNSRATQAYVFKIDKFFERFTRKIRQETSQNL